MRVDILILALVSAFSSESSEDHGRTTSERLSAESSSTSVPHEENGGLHEIRKTQAKQRSSGKAGVPSERANPIKIQSTTSNQTLHETYTSNVPRTNETSESTTQNPTERWRGLKRMFKSSFLESSSSFIFDLIFDYLGEPFFSGKCKVSTWGNWTKCSVDCGGGSTTRTRQITQGGYHCTSTEETTSCNTQHCVAGQIGPDTPGPCKTFPCIDCTVMVLNNRYEYLTGNENATITLQQHYESGEQLRWQAWQMQRCPNDHNYVQLALLDTENDHKYLSSWKAGHFARVELGKRGCTPATKFRLEQSGQRYRIRTHGNDYVSDQGTNTYNYMGPRVALLSSSSSTDWNFQCISDDSNTQITPTQ